ncbi:hypothetical protein N7513_010870 [Penicillium frequentans]|nr:hypothetical protein N7513_010870 [Penicillium glabrum]
MGGVPYGSKGCNTCRRRKVKCDENKPECMRCLKNGHVCTGYERNHVFIHNTTDTKVLAQRPRGRTFETVVKKAAATSSPVEVHTDVPRFNVNVQVRTQVVANFIDSYAPSALVYDGKSGKFMHLQDTFPIFIGRTPVLDKAVTALSSAFLAKRNQDYQLLSYSTRLYGESLQIVHRRIQTGRHCSQDFLFATVIFQLYELINASPLGFQAWLAHVQGSNAILSQYASSSPLSVTDHLFWRQLKFATICDAVGKRKSVYSYSPFWRHPSLDNPWREPIDEIQDFLIECSALMEQVDELIQRGNSSLQDDIHTGERLCHSCLLLKDKLDTGFREMQAKLGIPFSSPDQRSFWSELDDSIPSDLFPDAIEYPSISCAQTHLLWWTTYILVYPLIDQLFVFLHRTRSNVSFTLWTVPTSSSPTNTPSCTRTADLPDDLLKVAEHYANLICRSAKFLAQPGTKGMGAQVMLAPFSQATQFYHSQEATDKYRWCQAVFMVLPRLGFGMASFMKDLIWPKYEAATKRTPTISPQSQGDQKSTP